MSVPIEFHKMHGAGNDFVLIDARQQDFSPTPELATAIADRRFGIGCDQIMILRQPRSAEHLVRYEIWNPDGSQAAQCGNGARCVALFIELNGEFDGKPYSAESPSGIVGIRRCGDGEYELDMGTADFDPASIPLELAGENGLYHLDSPWGPVEFGAVSMGNPHSLVVVDEINDDRIPAIGTWMGEHDAFPDRVNAGFAQIESRSSIRLRVVERGPGETLACGSGACAAVAILGRRGLVDERVDVFLPGGRLVIQWRGNNEPLVMKGPAKYVFRGTMNE
ncbi:MAG: diaminopimelate epimerase [Xanthomonadales bacterium]|nr:diaminopimelate epimerase [Xanthomonadales bacterium]